MSRKMHFFLYFILLAFIIQDSSSFPHGQKSCRSCCKQNRRDSATCATEPVANYAVPEYQNSEVYKQWRQSYEKWQRDYGCGCPNNSSYDDTYYNQLKAAYDYMYELQQRNSYPYHYAPEPIKIIIQTQTQPQQNENTCPSKPNPPKEPVTEEPAPEVIEVEVDLQEPPPEEPVSEDIEVEVELKEPVPEEPVPETIELEVDLEEPIKEEEKEPVVGEKPSDSEDEIVDDVENNEKVIEKIKSNPHEDEINEDEGSIIHLDDNEGKGNPGIVIIEEKNYEEEFGKDENQKESEYVLENTDESEKTQEDDKKIPEEEKPQEDEKKEAKDEKISKKGDDHLENSPDKCKETKLSEEDENHRKYNLENEEDIKALVASLKEMGVNFLEMGHRILDGQKYSPVIPPPPPPAECN